MRHLSAEELIDYLEGRASETTLGAVDTHISKCTDCLNMKQELQELTLTLQQDSAFEPPEELVQWGVNLFQPMLKPSTSGKLRRIVASLVFDTFKEPMLSGVRRAALPPRQLLFRAGDVDIDVKIEATEANDRISLVGQVLSNATKFFDNTPVKLESHGTVRFKTTTNFVGEFSFDEVPKDTYHLSVDLPEGQITLFCVHRGNS
jgi:hypothetical protein